jgi:hypothetical protein
MFGQLSQSFVRNDHSWRGRATFLRPAEQPGNSPHEPEGDPSLHQEPGDVRTGWARHGPKPAKVR